MERLNYNTLRQMEPPPYYLEQAPERVLQFGAGNFLRGTFDYYIDVLNEKAGFNGKIVVVQSVTRGLTDRLNAQQGLFTFYQRGFENGQAVSRKRVISSISRCVNSAQDFPALIELMQNPHLGFIVSNTTESGIAFSPDDGFDDMPPSTFPGKLTRLLFERYRLFSGQPGKGFIILPAELLDDNGAALKSCVLQYAAAWKLDAGFTAWLDEENTFCSTLVDGIVSGYPANDADALNAENGYTDDLMVEAEPFSFWAVKAPRSVEKALPFEPNGLPVKIVDDHSAYMQRKKRILNGAHTSLALAAFLSGKDTVRECMEDRFFEKYLIDTIYNEILPTLTLPEEEMLAFAAAVVERFKNPFLDHSLLAISLGSVSKWRERLLPSFKSYYEKTGKLPRNITFSLAALLCFYTGSEFDGPHLIGRGAPRAYKIHDNLPALEFFAQHASSPPRAYADAVLANKDFWGEDLTAYPGLARTVAALIEGIRSRGMQTTLMERTRE